MQSSITTAIPTGQIKDFCVYSLYLDLDQQDQPQCANASLNTFPTDYETICCDGMIIDTTQNLYAYHPHPTNATRLTTNLENLVCCGLNNGAQAGGIGPILDTDNMMCNEGQSTPLASLAATNTVNAQLFRVTYTSASFGTGTEIGDYIPTQTPYCLWANTHSGIDGLANVTLPAPSFAPLPSATTDAEGDPLPSRTAGPGTTAFTSSQIVTATPAATSSTKTGEGVRGSGVARGLALAALGVFAARLCV